ncbi:zinc ABC transporter substrate-binding protein [Gordonia iterans]|uniref:Zinc ABC transporter substrate-binding protein n=1 Tax=Gordonia iterans TaxID=1004901 RepID=A0A2S0KDF3_9ACTN|nr:zinc ABC transporter substrate-binding protein AztC [Gordonia iterans]AVL99714.1 zinc ABC transporter substrate-binding protein [Gordonia iterans]
MSRQTSRFLAALLTALLAALCLTACGDGSGDRPRIVVTTNILGNVVSELVGDQAEVTVLMKPNADPHSFGISAQEANRMRNADLVVYNGLGLEEGIAQHVEAARRAGVPVFEAGAHADPIKYASGDAVGTLDPHFWTDPDRMKMVVSALRPVLAENVTDVDTAQLNGQIDDYLGELTELTNDMTAQFSIIPADRKRLVTNHHVFGYLAQRFGFEVIGAIIPGGTTLASPSSSDLASLTGAIDRYDVPAVFVDTSHPDKLAAALAKETGRDVKIVPLYSESLDEPGTEAGTYLGMMTVNTQRITDGLR